MATNGYGVLASRELDMNAFEALPRAIRDILNEAPVALSADEIQLIKRRYRLDDDELLTELKERIAAFQETATRELYPQHPQLGEFRYDKWPCRIRHRIYRRRRS